MSPQVTIFELIEKDLEGATIVVGFPGVGLVGTIAANHLINSQGLEQIGVIESPHFPAVSVVKDGVPHNPVRIYAGEQTCIPEQVKGNDTCNQLVVCVSEFSPPAQLTKPLVTTLFEWIVEKGCKRLISAEDSAPPMMMIFRMKFMALALLKMLEGELRKEGSSRSCSAPSVAFPE